MVHDFAVSPEEVQAGRAWSSDRLVQDTGRTEREKAVGHAFADEFTTALIEDSQARPARPACRGGEPAKRRRADHRGPIVSLAGDPSQPGIVGFSGGWPDVVADVQLFGTNSRGEELSEDLEVSVSQGGRSYPAALLPDPTITAGQVVTRPGISPQARARLQSSARRRPALSPDN